MKWWLLVIIAFFVPITPAFADSIFTSDTTITEDTGFSEVAIAPGVTVTIAPGVLVGFSDFFANNGTLVNLGSLHNSGHLDNYGVLNNSGIFANGQFFKNFGTFANSGIFANQDSFGNYGIMNNTGTINTNDECCSFGNFRTLNNTGTINNQWHIFNYCDASFYNTGTITGNPIENGECTYRISANSIVVLNEIAHASAITNDILGVEQVTLRWIAPNSTVVETEILPLSLTGSATDTFMPDEIGNWTVQADFDNGETRQQTFQVVLFVIPESPIGSIAIVISSMAALLGFIGVHAYRRNR